MSHPPSADQHDTAHEVILGVDTHKDIHVAATVSIHGALLDNRNFPTTAEGYQAMLDWATAFGPVRRAGVEGTHSYGAALTRHLLTAGISVIEVNQPDKAHRRRRGTAIDAEAAARAVPSGRATAFAKAGDVKAILVGADPALRDSMTGLSNPKLIRRCADLEPGQPDTPAAAAANTLRLLARRIIELTREVDDLNQHITEAVNAHTPELLQRYGVGPDPGHRRQPATAHQQSVLLRSQPHRDVLRQNPTAPAQPRRRPPSQLSPLHDRHSATSLGPTHPRLHRPTRQRRQDQTRSDPLPETLRRTRALRTHRPNTAAHQPAIDRLTSIGASSWASIPAGLDLVEMLDWLRAAPDGLDPRGRT